MSDPGEVAVLIPAAGEGTRLGGHRKQFRLLGDLPVLVQTLSVFERHPEIDHIYVATPDEAVQPLLAELNRVGISKLRSVVPGGMTRQESVRSALTATHDNIDVILVHDAVRPFVRLDEVSRVIRAVRKYHAASLSLPVADSVRRSDGVTFLESVPRENLYRMQTPQGFTRSLLIQAHESALANNVLANDEVELVQRLGASVRCVIGSTLNLKITTPEDWEWALQFWPVWEEAFSKTGNGSNGMSEVR